MRRAANGFDPLVELYVYVNTAYVTWAGITAGKAQSFYSFTGGGDNWANFASPDRKGFNEPDAPRLHRFVRRRLYGDDLGAKAPVQSTARAAAPATARISALRISPISGSTAARRR